MMVSGTTLRRRHGLAGLLVALFVVAGLVFSYGLGHAPPARWCTEHAVSAPASTPADVAAATGHKRGSVLGSAASAAPTAPVASAGLPGPAAAMAPLLHRLPDVSMGTRTMPVPHGPAHACLCLAVLFALFVLGLLAGGLGRAFLRLPARTGWAPTVPPGG
ncbi:hypothetical protein, partial [Actinomadura rubrisoli]